MRGPWNLPATTKRRTFLAALGTGGLGLASQLGEAHEAATLPMDITITRQAQDETGDIAGLDIEATNLAAESVEPVITAWCAGRQTQHPWKLLNGAQSLPPGETTVWRARAPGDEQAVRLRTDVMAQVTIYDRGREARALHWFETDSETERDHVQPTGVRR